MSDTANPTAEAAFKALLAALRREALDDDAGFERIASYRRTVERLATRYADGLPLTERSPAKAEAA